MNYYPSMKLYSGFLLDTGLYPLPLLPQATGMASIKAGADADAGAIVDAVGLAPFLDK